MTHVWAEGSDRAASEALAATLARGACPRCSATRGVAPGRGPVWSPPMEIPDDLRYSTDHEWVRVEGTRVRIGITDYAQDALGDIVFVDLPAVGQRGRGGRAARRGGVDQVGLGDLRAAGGHGRRRRTTPSTRARSRSTRTPTGRGGSARSSWPPGADPDDLLDAAAYGDLIAD